MRTVYGGGHRTCGECGATVFGSKLHNCKIETPKIMDGNNIGVKQPKYDTGDIVYITPEAYKEGITKTLPNTKFVLGFPYVVKTVGAYGSIGTDSFNWRVLVEGASQFVHEDVFTTKDTKNQAIFEYNYHPSMERYIARLVKEWREHKKIILAVDFDDTLNPWKFNDFNYNEIFKLIKEAKDLGAYIVIFSACKSDRFDYIRSYCKETGGFEIDGINENVIELPYGNDRKIYYNHFLDDRAGLMEAMTILSITMMRIKTDGKNGGDNFDV